MSRERFWSVRSLSLLVEVDYIQGSPLRAIPMDRQQNLRKLWRNIKMNKLKTRVHRCCYTIWTRSSFFWVWHRDITATWGSSEEDKSHLWELIRDTENEPPKTQAPWTVTTSCVCDEDWEIDECYIRLSLSLRSCSISYPVWHSLYPAGLLNDGPVVDNSLVEKWNIKIISLDNV